MTVLRLMLTGMLVMVAGQALAESAGDTGSTRQSAEQQAPEPAQRAAEDATQSRNAAAQELAPGEVVESVPEGADSVPAQRVYKSYDRNGNVIFSDEPVEGARQVQEVDVHESNSIRFEKTRKVEVPVESKPVTAPDFHVSIVSPVAQTHYHNSPDPVPISVQVSPSLGDLYQLEVTDNGNKVEKNNGKFALDYPDRGEHKLVARVIDRDGKVLAESAAVTIYVHRVSKLTNPQNKAKAKP